MSNCKNCNVQLTDKNWDRSCCNECGDFLCVECMDKNCCPDCDIRLCGDCTCMDCNDECPQPSGNPPYLEPHSVINARWTKTMDSVVIGDGTWFRPIQLKGSDGMIVMKALETAWSMQGLKVKMNTEHIKDGLAFLEATDADAPGRYNASYGDSRVCECGHPYHRHFDSHEDMAPVGCKYCGCYKFKEKI